MSASKIKYPVSVSCFHCGEACSAVIDTDAKKFCCEGCKQVYLLLKENNLCNYYNFENGPGVKAKGKFISGRFGYLDDADTARKLVQFTSEGQTNVTFYLPQIHCSSCIFLLENLHRIEPGIIKSNTDFQRKEIFIIFDPTKISLRKVVELLAFTGYEPAISLKDSTQKKAAVYDKKQLYKIGIAGFCFANIMMLSFPEYFSSGNIEQPGLKTTFTWLNLFLSLPVLFYSAAGFFSAALKGLRRRVVNIDVPIALALIVSFARSYYEILTASGAGWLDSATGIVFFMLVGRWFQDKTYDSLSFDRDYQSYFPLGVSIVKNGIEKNVPVTKLAIGDNILIRNQEMIPADAILLKGNANVDYSFVSGESEPLQKGIGELIYAGGKQCGSEIELKIVSEVSQSYITRLWNNDIFKNKKTTEPSFVHPWSRYFTIVLFVIAITTAVFWQIYDSSKLLPAVTAILIVACPCSLLLSATFTYGNMLRIFGSNKLYLKNAGIIASLAKIDTIVFDKTGTITQNQSTKIKYRGTPLTKKQWSFVEAVTRQSSHPLSKIITRNLNNCRSGQLLTVAAFREFAGKGMEAVVNATSVKIGSATFVNEYYDAAPNDGGSHIHLLFNKVHMGSFTITIEYRRGVEAAINSLLRNKYELHLLSGDNDTEKNTLARLFGKIDNLRFGQLPQDKVDKIKQLQAQHKKVLMIGDGINDAGAFMQSNIGIAVSDNTSHFSPACDAIIDGSKIGNIHQFLKYAKSGKSIVTASFALSVLYNVVGLSFAVQGTMSPIVAAILMPSSSISIVLLVTLLSSFSARRAGLGKT